MRRRHASRGCARAGLILTFYAVSTQGAAPQLPLDQDGNRVFKVAMLALAPPTDFTWSYRHNLGRNYMIDELLSKYNDLRVESEFFVLPETDEHIADKLDEWGQSKQNLVITTSFAYQDPTLEAAVRWPNTNWVHVSGFKTGTPNFAVAWCRVFQSRYLTGIAAASVSRSGMLGYVAAFSYIPEVVRGFNAFTLGARKYDPAARVLVNFLMTWHDRNRTDLASNWLLELGCDVIAGHTNDRSLYDPFISRGLKGAGYYANMRDQYGDNIVISAFFDWGPMYTRFAEDTIAGRAIPPTFDGMERGVPVVSTPSQFVQRRARDMLDAEGERLLRGDDLHPVHRGSAMIFCGPLNDEYGVPILRNSSDCADLDSHPRPSFQQFGGGLLNMEWFVEGVEDLGVVTLAHEDCGAGYRYTWIREGRWVMDNARHQHGPAAPGKKKLRLHYRCDPCPPGTASSLRGSAHCHECPAGTVSSGTQDGYNATMCNKCPEGTLSGPAAAACTPCPSGFLNYGEGNADCPVEESSSSWVSRYWWVVLIVVVAALLLVGFPTAYKYWVQHRRMMRLYNNNAVAESCAMSIAEMRLEDVDYINSIPNPNRIQQAFIMIIANLKEYRSFLPQALLEHEQGEDTDGEPHTSDSTCAASGVKLDMQCAGPETPPPGDPSKPNPLGLVSRRTSVSKPPRGSVASSENSERTISSVPRGSYCPPTVKRTGLQLAEFKPRRGSLMLSRCNLHGVGSSKDAVEVASQYASSALSVCQQHRGVANVVANLESAMYVLMTWNGHKPHAQHATEACVAALRVTERSEELSVSATAGPGETFSGAAAGRVTGAVATGQLWIGNVGIDGQRVPSVIGGVVSKVSCMLRLATQLGVDAVAGAATHEQTRSVIRARVIDAVKHEGRDELVYELRPVTEHPKGHDLYVQAFSGLRSGEFASASARLQEYLQQNRRDTQALRLLRVCAVLAQAENNPAKDADHAYTRREQMSWQDFEHLSAERPLPDAVEELLESMQVPMQDHPDAQQAWAPAREASSATDPDAASGALNASFSVPQVLSPPIQDAAVLSAQVQKVFMDAENDTEDRLALATQFSDARGQMYHRSGRVLGKGAFGEVWLGMAGDGAMVAVKSIRIQTGQASTQRGSPTKSGFGSRRRNSSSSSGSGGDSPRSGCRPIGSPAGGGKLALPTWESSATQGSLAQLRQLEEMVSEVTLMCRLQHDNIVQYLGCAVEGQYVLICMEYLPGGSLQGVLVQFNNELPASCCQRFVRDIVLGLEFIHDNGIIHRDLKPANVLMTVEGMCKLADFGASAELGQKAAMGAAGSSMQGPVGTTMYMSPEQASGSAVAASDIWSFGICVCELCTGRLPWPPIQNGLAFMRNLAKPDGPNPEVPADMPENARDLAVLCIQRAADTRPTAKQLLDHPYLLS
eukprot:TRINITY_DN9284_c0_g1_i2.p1 TRINITY_DN9284_c0_g1~~TRINITY_DN9284_c0_g1_i2.p1  ORF type:complete len:1447 (+),score=331.32 TRINITY_DN9284_c0_g1_i2:88-4341(+)